MALTVAAALVGWFSFNQVGEAQSVVNEDSVPDLAAAFRVAQFSSTLVDAAPRLATATSQEELSEIAAGIAETNSAFVEQLAALEESTADTEQYQRIRTDSASLIANIAAIHNDKVELSRLAVQKEVLQIELAELRGQLGGIMAPALDDQFFFGMTGFRNLGQPPAPREEHLSEDQLVVYRHLSEIQSNANISTQLFGYFLQPLRRLPDRAAAGAFRGRRRTDRDQPGRVGWRRMERGYPTAFLPTLSSRTGDKWWLQPGRSGIAPAWTPRRIAGEQPRVGRGFGKPGRWLGERGALAEQMMRHSLRMRRF